MPPTKVFIVDDHPMFRWGMRQFIDGMDGFSCAGEACDGASALDGLRDASPDVVLLDLAMPGVDGVGFLRAVNATSPRPKVVVLSQTCESERVRELVGVGIEGYVLKSEESQEVGKALAAVVRGEPYFSPKVGAAFWRLLREEQPQPRASVPHAVSPREMQVARHVAQGKSNKAIAEILHCSEHTIKCHRANLMRKIGAKNSLDVAAWVAAAGQSD